MERAIDGQDRFIEASPQAPATARCPVCDWPVDLRWRRTMTGEVWFWKHQEGAPDTCIMRYRVAA